MTYFAQEEASKINNWLIRNDGGQKTMGWHIRSAERKKTVHQESYIQQNYVSKWRWNKDIPI